MDSEYVMIVSTCADMESARRIAGILVDKRLVACAQLFPIVSIYTWQGKACEDDEVMLFLKSKTALYDEIAAAIKESHPYDVPEIIQIPITDGLPDYLRWIDDSVSDGQGNSQ